MTVVLIATDNDIHDKNILRTQNTMTNRTVSISNFVILLLFGKFVRCPSVVCPGPSKKEPGLVCNTIRA